MSEEQKKGGGKRLHNYYTNQMNIALFVDVKKLLLTGSVQNAVWLFDNTGNSSGNGTAQLSSSCKLGTVVNWLVYALDMERRADGSWPSVPRISNIVFLDASKAETACTTPFEELKIYGGPDCVRSQYTPSYSYWSGNVRMDQTEGNYPYRLIIEIEDKETGYIHCFNVDGMSLNIIRNSL